MSVRSGADPGREPGCLGPRPCRKRPHHLDQNIDILMGPKVPIGAVEGLNWGRAIWGPQGPNCPPPHPLSSATPYEKFWIRP